MTRLRPGGSFSRRKPSPWWKSTGGVDRSTSSTKPGRGGLNVILSAPPEDRRSRLRRSVVAGRAAPPGGCAALRSSSALSFGTEVEGDLHRAAGAGLGGVGDGVGDAGEGIGRGHQAAEIGRGDELE